MRGREAGLQARERAASGGVARAAVASLLTASVLQLSCVLLPVRIAPAVEGVAVDGASGAVLPDVVVVVRFDAVGDGEPGERRLLGYREGTSDASGRFRIGPLVRPGIGAWPRHGTEARLAAAIRPGYRCPRPGGIDPGESVRVTLAPAEGVEELRETCRPVPAAPGEATAYMDAWRALHPPQVPPAVPVGLEPLLEARAPLGFGANCAGPILDLALAPGGGRAAFAAAGSGTAEIYSVSLGRRAPVRPLFVAAAEALPPRRLAWTGPDELAVSGPTASAGPAEAALPGVRVQSVWRAAGSPAPIPAAPDFGALAGRPADAVPAPLDPAERPSDSASRWAGRSFAVDGEVDARTGLPRTRLHVTREDGSRYALPLPGEACGVRGRFGRPQDRIAADGRSAVDLRFVDGGCHAIRIDLESGDWTRLDAAATPARCRTTRRVPPTQLRAAARGWSREAEAALQAAGADLTAAYVLEIDPPGPSVAETRTLDGEPLRVVLPPFPVATPLRRIEVSVLGRVEAPIEGAPPAVPGPRPL